MRAAQELSIKILALQNTIETVNEYLENNLVEIDEYDVMENYISGAKAQVRILNWALGLA